MLELLSDIRSELKENSYKNESQVCGSIVRPILEELDWPRKDVKTEHPSKNKERLDYGLCIDGKLHVIIEVKAVGKLESKSELKKAEKQLFNYADHERTPLAILTDGRKWRIYYIHETGDFADRLVCSLDILDQKLGDVGKYLSRYLACSKVKSGNAEKNAKRALLAKKSISKTWQRIAIDEPDDELVNFLINETEEEEGTAPNRDDVIAFLKNITLPQIDSLSQKIAEITDTISKLPQTINRNIEAAPKERRGRKTTYVLFGEKKTCTNAASACVEIISKLARRDSNFLKRLNNKLNDSRLLSRNKSEKMFSPKFINIDGGWWLNTNTNKADKIKIFKTACKVARIKFNKDEGLKIDFPTNKRKTGRG